jgi:hypothetical protein
MATVIEQLQALPPRGVVEVAYQQINLVLAVRYDLEQYPHRFIWLTPCELHFLQQQGIEAGFNYPLDYLVAILSRCPKLPLIQ